MDRRPAVKNVKEEEEKKKRASDLSAILLMIIVFGLKSVHSQTFSLTECVPFSWRSQIQCSNDRRTFNILLRIIRWYIFLLGKQKTNSFTNTLYLQVYTLTSSQFSSDPSWYDLGGGNVSCSHFFFSVLTMPDWTWYLYRSNELRSLQTVTWC